MDRVLNAQIRELYGMMNRVDEKTDDPVVWKCGEDGEGKDCLENLCRRVCR